MTNFEAAVELSFNNWVASLPTEFDLPEPTQSYKEGIAKLMDKMRGDRYHKFTRNTARVILIAAILLAIATVTLAATVGREFIVKNFSNFSVYNVIDSSNNKNVEDIEIGYLPDGFEKSDSTITSKFHLLNFKNSDNWISVYKGKINTDIAFDTEYKNRESIKISAFEGVYYENPNTNYSGVIWNNNDYTYTVEGNVGKEILIKTAESVS